MSANSFTQLADSGFSFRNWLLLGVAAEVVIFGVSYLLFPGDWGEVFRHAARYSGRLSLFIYLFAFSYYGLTYRYERETVMLTLKKIMLIFCVLHLIHFGFLATNVLLNDIELIPVKLAGGTLGYLFIVFYPFFIERVRNKRIHFIYFLYVGIVIIGTYLARIKGDFPGVIPGPIHYFGIIATVLSLLVFGWLVFRAGPQVPAGE
ncbi:MAG: hypothetical protein AAF840_00115 [Bacteroidota bacterium]